jgi:hypothetical protein
MGVDSIDNSRCGEAGVAGREDFWVDGVETFDATRSFTSGAGRGVNISKNRGGGRFMASGVGIGGSGGASVAAGFAKKFMAVIDLCLLGARLMRTL